MNTRGRFRPSASMIVAIAALVVATSGTAIAAGRLVSGDRLIRKGSLSGNRLRNHTLTGVQINLSRLGKVPSATHADGATNATTAASGTSAATATTAASATSAATATTAGTANLASAANSLNGIQIVDGATITNNPGSQDSQIVPCPAGMSAISGGVLTSGGIEQSVGEEAIVSLGSSNNAFEAFVNNISGAGAFPVVAAKVDSFHVYVVCVNGSVARAGL